MAEINGSINTEPRFCSNCGDRLGPGSNFCGRCGAEVPAAGGGVLGRRVADPDGVEYIGFWLRLAAAIIDGIITGVVATILNAITGIPAIGSRIRQIS